MTRFVPAAALAIAACAQTAAAPGEAQPDAARPATPITDLRRAPEGCALAVRFGSYAMGIDRGAANRVEALLTSDPAVSSITRHRWGMEGEFTLCVGLRDGMDAAEVAQRIRPVLPAKPRGPIEVILADGTRIRAPNR